VDARWTIEELGQAVEAVLSQDGPIQESGRIRDVPDRRTIRYYTTLGLIDRAAAMRGRTALYGRRHLEQLVAIKRLQAEGLSLAEVQATLAGITPQKLRALARVPESFEMPIHVTAASEIAPPRRAFWSEVPERTERVEKSHPPESSSGLLTPVRLDTSTILTIAARRSLNPDDIRAIESAAEPLLRTLRARALIAEEGEDT
jgi:DNA-binding transcriptional MerR regulator